MLTVPDPQPREMLFNLTQDLRLAENHGIEAEATGRYAGLPLHCGNYKDAWIRLA
jgi:hypothetical protein